MKARQTRFVRVALRVAEALDKRECLLAGGLAVAAHGFVRATRDVDILTRLPLSDARSRLSKRGLETELLRGDVFEGGFSCLKGTCQGLPFDVLPELVPIHWSQALPIEDPAVEGLRVVSLQDLLALKLKAQGAKDLMDAAMLVLLHPETKDRARELATAYRALDRFDRWLEDPRLHAQAREEAEAERREARTTPKRGKGAPNGRRRPARNAERRRTR